MMPKYIDTHCHLNHRDFREDWYDVARRTLGADCWMIVVGSDYNSSLRAVEIAEHFDQGIYAAIGLHPRFVDAPKVSRLARAEEFFDITGFGELAVNPKVVAVGEVGLDFYNPKMYDGDFERRELVHKLQKELLQMFLDLAVKRNLPVILHLQDAYKEMLEVFEGRKKDKKENPRSLVHHFTGSLLIAEHFLHYGSGISFTGMAIRSHLPGSVLSKLPMESVLVESECPFLVAEPMAGGRTDPSSIAGAVEFLARLKKIPHDEAARQIVRNAMKIFPKLLIPHP